MPKYAGDKTTERQSRDKKNLGKRGRASEVARRNLLREELDIACKEANRSAGAGCKGKDGRLLLARRPCIPQTNRESEERGTMHIQCQRMKVNMHNYPPEVMPMAESSGIKLVGRN